MPLTKGNWIFTKNGEMDLLWVFLAANVTIGDAIAIIAAVKGGMAAVAALLFIFGLILALAIIKVPIDRARILAESKTLAAVADGLGDIASAGGNIWKDDERDPHWESDRAAH